jgi:carboxypeptidase C (cathepsin A)
MAAPGAVAALFSGSIMSSLCRSLTVAICLVAPTAHLLAQGADVPPSTATAQQGQAKQQPSARETVEATKHIPADSVTQHTLNLNGRTVSFKATAGSFELNDDKGGDEVNIAYIAYQLDGGDPLKRPVTFVFNGGPGAGSAWLQLGAVGPWRLPMGGLSPSSSPTLVDNEETWLDFTDLVFIDPPGTGYSRIVASGEDARRKLWSVNGDIEALSVVIRRWLVVNGRLPSHKFILGESYGGFRGPRLAEELATKQGIGINGLVLISPALEIGFESSTASGPFEYASRLPSYAAAFRERAGNVSRDDLADVERYASHEYLDDFLRGPNDKDAVARMVQHVVEYTGLAPELVRQLGGRVDKNAFLREFDRAQGRVAAFYDTTVKAYDPNPTNYHSRWLDPVLDALNGPFSTAMMDIYNNRLGWKDDERYELLNESVSRAWNWGSALEGAQSIDALKRMMALDPSFRVLITHGLTDVQTPYYATQLLINQIPDYGPAGRIKLKVYGGGHMHYSRDESRKALRDDARRLIEQR